MSPILFETLLEGVTIVIKIGFGPIIVVVFCGGLVVSLKKDRDGPIPRKGEYPVD